MGDTAKEYYVTWTMIILNDSVILNYVKMDNGRMIGI